MVYAETRDGPMHVSALDSLIAACRAQPWLRSLRLSLVLADAATVPMLALLRSSPVHPLVKHVCLLNSSDHFRASDDDAADEGQEERSEHVMRRIAQFINL